MAAVIAHWPEQPVTSQRFKCRAKSKQALRIASRFHSLAVYHSYYSKMGDNDNNNLTDLGNNVLMSRRIGETCCWERVMAWIVPVARCLSFSKALYSSAGGSRSSVDWGTPLEATGPSCKPPHSPMLWSFKRRTGFAGGAFPSSVLRRGGDTGRGRGSERSRYEEPAIV